MKLLSQTRRVKALHRKLHPPPLPEIWLPLGVFLDDEGHYLPGQEEIHERCKRAGILPKIYMGLHPDEDGTEP